jgi:WD40 repeat protein
MIYKLRLIVLIILVSPLVAALPGAAKAQGGEKPPPITVENAGQVAHLHTLGAGVLTNVLWADEGKTLLAVTRAGLWRYDLSHAATPAGVPAPTRLTAGPSVTDRAFLSADEGWLATIRDVDSTLTLTNRVTGDTWQAMQAPRARWIDVKFSAPSEGLAIGLTDNVNRLWIYDLDQRRVRLVIDSVFAYALHPDGRTLVTSERRGFRVWDLTTLRETRRFGNRTHAGAQFRFSADGKTLYSVQRNSRLQAFDLASGQVRYEIADKLIAVVAYDTEARTAMVWGNPIMEVNVHLYDLAAGTRRATLRAADERLENGQAILAAAISPDGKLAATYSWKNLLRVWDTQTGELRREQAMAFPGFLRFDPAGQALIFRQQAALVRYVIATGVLEKLPGDYGHVNADLDFSPDGAWLVTAGQDGSLRRWSLGTVGEPQAQIIPTHPTSSLAYSLDFSADGKTLMFSDARGMWRYRHREAGLTLPVQSTDVRCLQVSISPDGKWLACAPPNTVYVWEAATGKLVWDYAKLETRRFVVRSIAFSPDSRVLAIAQGNNLITRLALDTLFITSFIKPRLSQTSLAYSPDGAMLATIAGDNIVHLWDAKTGQERLRMRGRGTRPQDGDLNGHMIAFSPDGRLLAAVDRFQRVRLYDTATGKAVAELLPETFKASLVGVAFSPDGTTIAAPTTIGLVVLWGIKES